MDVYLLYRTTSLTLDNSSVRSRKMVTAAPVESKRKKEHSIIGYISW
jgi:hypothetical protein